MTQQTPAVQNKRLLWVALGLAVMVAVLYNIHMAQVRQAARGAAVEIIQVNQDLRVGDKITDKAIERVEVPDRYAKSLQDVVVWNDRNLSFVIGREVTTPVSKGQWLEWSHVTAEEKSQRPSMALTQGMTMHTLEVDPRNAPGQTLRIGDWVDLWGIFPVNGKMQTLRILEGVKVLEAGGLAPRERIAGVSARGGDEGQSSIKKIGIEVSPAVSRQLYNVVSHATELMVDLRSPQDRDKFPRSATGTGPEISQEVAEFAKSAASGAPAGRPEP